MSQRVEEQAVECVMREGRGVRGGWRGEGGALGGPSSSQRKKKSYDLL